MKIRIAQCLCPARHCMIGFGLGPATETPGNPEYISDEGVILQLKETVGALIADRGDLLAGIVDEYARRKMNPWCGLCGAPSTTWLYEVRRSREFKDWEEAEKVLRSAETAQMMTKLMFDVMGESYDAERKRRMN